MSTGKADFMRQLEAQGYGNIRELECEPNLKADMHTHETTNRVLVLAGEWSLVTESGTTTYAPGQICELAAGVLHTEQTGPQGATIVLGGK